LRRSSDRARYAPDEQRAVGPVWAQTLGVALNSEVVFVGGSARRPSSRCALLGAGNARLHGVHCVPCLRRRDRGLAYGGETEVAKDIEVYAHYGHEGGVD
jgi:hypothetical protein